jgi:large subunit ribosomal protein L35
MYIGSHKIINGEHIELEKTTVMPKIKFVPEPNTYYTIIMVDPDAPSKTNPIYKYWLHMLIINNNEGIVEFEKPNPPKGSGPHRYIIYLFKQENKLDNVPFVEIPVVFRPNVSPERVPTYSRTNFDLDEFINRYNLTLIANTMFMSERK